MSKLFLLGLVAVGVLGDCYLHMPRGSNNRLNEKSANRNNGNRLFDSQNNNRGGYNKGDFGTQGFSANGGEMPSTPFTKELNAEQYSEMYYEGSVLPVEWTAQHGCGGSEENDAHKLNCNMLIQFTCNTIRDEAKLPKFLQVELKDGRNTNTPDAANSYTDATNDGARKTANDNNKRGRHESEAWYYDCQKRNRNMGLFLADQKLKGNAAKYTRQNPNGNRRGLECPEERDYFPYWKPSPWIDVAYLTDTVQDCTSGPGSFSVKTESQNTADKYVCLPENKNNEASRNAAWKAAHNKTECEAAKGTWTAYSHKAQGIDCRAAEWSRVNHLGNGRNGQPLTYNWTLPTVDSKGLGQFTDIKNNMAKCVMRMRYNISTDDYDPRNTNSSHNHYKSKGVISPVQNNPTVDIGASLQGLKLAINTAQFGRTFQDRSHTFYIKKRPSFLVNKKIHNLQARGKRGNIVQTFPSVEYDYMPNYLPVSKADFIHVQWTGSNTHNNGNPAGDGQAGDAGEGTGGTDRHNIVCLRDRADNYPAPFDQDMKSCLFSQFDCWKHQDTAPYMNQGLDQTKMDWKDCAAYLATGGFYKTDAEVKANAKNLNNLLNNVPASLHGGLLLRAKPTAAGSYHYMNTRNNNFSNRSQKGTIIVL
mmetsp:Transcript_15846/g.22299  ORF Transcript_15846/g.22299 Transcript_15846/m.22299 type:complete len:645 (-) Transcript_15846:297-2231(-)